MSYLYPPATAFDTTALIAGTVASTLVAAPGVGFAIRVCSVWAGLSRTATGALDVTFPNVGRVTGMQLTGTSWGQLIIPEPGIMMPENTALTVSYVSTVAAGSGYSGVYYFIEAL